MFSWLITTASAAVIQTNLPGTYDLSQTGPVGAIGNIYLFATGIGGFLAFIMITYGGIKWMMARGNPGDVSDARDQITQALLGLLLLAGAYIILNTINPELTLLRVPTLTQLATSTPVAGGTYAATRCSNDNHTGSCEVSFLQCTENSGNWECKPKPNLIWVCRTDATVDEYGNELAPSVVKFCNVPTASGLGGGGKGTCDSNCQSLIRKNCDNSPEQNTGQCRGIQ